eukprot:349741-Amphidinium_carterae.1
MRRNQISGTNCDQSVGKTPARVLSEETFSSCKVDKRAFTSCDCPKLLSKSSDGLQSSTGCQHLLHCQFEAPDELLLSALKCDFEYNSCPMPHKSQIIFQRFGVAHNDTNIQSSSIETQKFTLVLSPPMREQKNIENDLHQEPSLNRTTAWPTMTQQKTTHKCSPLTWRNSLLQAGNQQSSSIFSALETYGVVECAQALLGGWGSFENLKPYRSLRSQHKFLRQ